ncbi:MAG: hypothetical protein N3B01_11185 [Verrucomicrobiae bacterium]|nr:hypothetical protein [Verrucomicrobiae bacterium]
MKPWDRHALLYLIEQGLKPKIGHRYEWETGVASQNPLAALFQNYDWADEVPHARFGRVRYVSEFENPAGAVRYGDEFWSKILMNWNRRREEGFTQNRNWWPDVYREACQRWGIEPDPKVLAYNVTYEKQRADLKTLTPSG